MYPSLEKIVKNIPRAITDPRRAASLAYRRMFPFGIRPKDPEAYRIGAWSYGAAPRVLQLPQHTVEIVSAARRLSLSGRSPVAAAR